MLTNIQLHWHLIWSLCMTCPCAYFSQFIHSLYLLIQVRSQTLPFIQKSPSLFGSCECRPLKFFTSVDGSRCVVNVLWARMCSKEFPWVMGMPAWLPTLQYISIMILLFNSWLPLMYVLKKPLCKSPSAGSSLFVVRSPCYLYPRIFWHPGL